MNKNQLKQKHKEIIQELEEPELMAYLDNISRNKIDNLSFFTDSNKAYCLSYIDKLAELEEEPFKKGAVNRIESFLTVIYDVEDIRLDSFKETLTEEKDIELVNKLTESVEVEVPSYDFKNFKLIEPEGVVESGS